MGYDVHITRAVDWFENGDAKIPLADWLAYVEADPEMRLDNFAEAQAGAAVVRYEHAGIAVWTTYSGHEESGNKAWFDFHDGNIVVKNPDEEILGKMCRIAEALGARVQGDDGEYYPASHSESHPESSPSAPPPAQQASAKASTKGPRKVLRKVPTRSESWWTRLFGRR